MSTFCEILKSICDADPDSFQLYKDYSGRGMYGRTCVGVVCSSGIALASAVMEEIAANYIGDDDFDMNEVAYAFSKGSEDSMGRDTIVYFPGTEWDLEDDKDESDDEDEGDDEAPRGHEREDFHSDDGTGSDGPE